MLLGESKINRRRSKMNNFFVLPLVLMMMAHHTFHFKIRLIIFQSLQECLS